MDENEVKKDEKATAKPREAGDPVAPHESTHPAACIPGERETPADPADPAARKAPEPAPAPAPTAPPRR